HQEGKKLVADDVILENSEIIPPCYIGNNVKLINTKIGPNVSIGTNSVVENSTITNSLIQNNTAIKNATLNNAMIGNHVEYDGNFTSVSLGDYSQLT
ncbi:MAG: nucleotidyltransferase, partial [Flavobacteriaceae bacterium]|nr:nucleotidyltransferase [Flavobacteriaceae bacterium]